MALAPEELEAIEDMMAKTPANVTNEEFASRTVGLLIFCKGNLNQYQKTLEIAFELHERLLLKRRYGV